MPVKAKAKSAGRTATMHNWSPITKAKKNKSGKGRKTAAKRAATPNGSGAKPKTRTITKYVTRPGVTAKPNKGKKGKKGHKKNGGGFSLLKFANPGLRNISQVGKQALIGVSGAVGAKILTAGEIGVLDRFAPELAQHKLMPYARPVATVLNGYLIVAPVAGMLKASPQSRQAIKYASLFAGGLDMLDALIGGDEVASIGQKFRSLVAGTSTATTPATVQTAQNTAIASGAAQGAAAEAISAGLTTEEAKLVATRAFEGAQLGLGELRGIPSVSDYELSPGGSEWLDAAGG